MNQHIKIIVLFLAALSITSVGFAQQNERKPTESVIVMTKARLDSLLTGIANSKRAQLAERKQKRLANSKLTTQISARPGSRKLKKYQLAPSQNAQKTRNPVHNNARIFDELNRINQRIDMLMMKMYQTPSQTYGNYPERPGAIIIPNSAGYPRRMYYQRDRSFVPNRPRYSGNAGTRVQDTLSAEINNLQNKIEALQAKITNLAESPNSANKKEISRLKGRIDRLNAQLEKANRIIESGKPQKITKETYGNHSLITVLKNYRQNIYFANNSATLNSAAKALLLQLAQMIKRNDQHVIVLVQGYASKTGSALYNYKLSLERANAVKNILTNYGISAGKIETLGHGVNKSHNAPAARKVEISLLIN